MIRHVHEIKRDPKNPYYPDSIEKYFNHPQNPLFNNLSYPAYFSQFILEKRKRPNRQPEDPDTPPTSWRDGLGNYVYHRRHLQVTHSPFQWLVDGESFFYALLLEK